AVDRLFEAHRRSRRHRARHREPRSASRAERIRRSPARGMAHGRGDGLSGARLAERRALSLERTPQLRVARSRALSRSRAEAAAPDRDRTRFRLLRMTMTDSADDFFNDPLWYKDAIIYQVHVRSFFDQ